jgi:hypothetical protein
MQYNVVKLFKKTCFTFKGKISLLSSMSECCYSLVSVRILKLMLSVIDRRLPLAILHFRCTYRRTASFLKYVFLPCISFTTNPPEITLHNLKNIVLKISGFLLVAWRPFWISFLLCQQKVSCCHGYSLKMVGDVDNENIEFHSCLIHFEDVRQSTSLISQTRLGPDH